ncbi:glycosyltransferase family 4 protein [Amycolatopsis sp. CA-230715]|uniref:glycosyltransferase family 4 protein n=1 Tax=Amycolatopsis sp. CA-230715 TaxID=2745196 RepID=UPI001C019E6D|nr:glycosyltransferase family 4 protein [Amycolatopsis sp. CA-230715]QWF84375.1 D-inositol 3-phosphate glycosyltransferase [Amycolatopsis sp. CA-230715]
MTRVALLTYRGNPRSGGQGVYVRHLSRELVALGHRVEVFSGPPYPELDPGVALTKVPSLDLFAEPNPFRTPEIRELRRVADWVEFAGMRTGGFPEPLAFSLRVAPILRRRRAEFDLVHDNQGLGYGLLATGLPTVATVHHPIAVDRELKLAHTPLPERPSVLKWHRFVTMQHRVARRIPLLLTVSGASRDEIAARMAVPPDRIRVVPISADTRVFRPGSAPRTPGRIVTVASADEPLKGLAHLLDAMPAVGTAKLIVVGKPKEATARKVAALGDAVEFRSGLSDAELADLVSSAEIACVPSMFEGFSLPAAEAMACGTPVVASSGGALPEVVGDAAELVPPADPAALAAALRKLLRDPARRAELSEAGIRRAAEFSWRRTAAETARQYHHLLGAEAGTPVPSGER